MRQNAQPIVAGFDERAVLALAVPFEGGQTLLAPPAADQIPDARPVRTVNGYGNLPVERHLYDDRHAARTATDQQGGRHEQKNASHAPSS